MHVLGRRSSFGRIDCSLAQAPRAGLQCPTFILMSSMQIIAHRGASLDFPENTLEAFSQAIARGSSCVETDLRVCGDGALVLCHDPVIEANDGPGICIAEHGLPHIRAAATHGQRLAELGDLLALLASARCRLHLEIKPGPLQNNVVEDVAGKMRNSKVRGLISSFDPAIVARASRCGVRTMLLMDRLPIDAARRARACGAGMLGVDIRAIKGARAAKIADKIPTYAFTVNTMEDLRRCHEAGLAGVYSDHPDLLSVLRKQIKQWGRENPQRAARTKREMRLLDEIKRQVPRK